MVLNAAHATNTHSGCHKAKRVKHDCCCAADVCCDVVARLLLKSGWSVGFNQAVRRSLYPQTPPLQIWFVHVRICRWQERKSQVTHDPCAPSSARTPTCAVVYRPPPLRAPQHDERLGGRGACVTYMCVLFLRGVD